MLTNELIEFIDLSIQDCFTNEDFVSDYEEMLNYVVNWLVENEKFEVVKETESEYGGTRTEIAPLFGFVIEGVHEKLLHQIEGILEATLVGWYQQKLVEK